MSGFPPSPRLQKGALVAVDLFNPLASIIVFQYNPETLTRSLTANAQPSRTEQQTEVMRVLGPPAETINLEIELDATDQLEKGDPTAVSLGLHPTLAALENLLYPKSAKVIIDEVLKKAGVLEVTPPQQPLTFFVWGNIKRVLPVRVNEMSITEEFFDPTLNPIRARVRLGLRVLNYRDLGLPSVGGAAFLAHQIQKELMATQHGLGTLASASFSLSQGLTIT